MLYMSTLTSFDFHGGKDSKPASSMVTLWSIFCKYVHLNIIFPLTKIELAPNNAIFAAS